MAKKKKGADEMEGSLVLGRVPYMEELSGTVVAVDADARTLDFQYKKPRSKKHLVRKDISWEIVASLYVEGDVSSFAEAEGCEGVIRLRPTVQDVDEASGALRKFEGFSAVFNGEGTFIVASDLATSEGEVEGEEKPAKKKEKKDKKADKKAGKKGKKEDKKAGKKKKDEDEDDEDDDEDEGEEVTAATLNAMKMKELKKFIKEEELDINPAEYDGVDELREAVAEELDIDLEEEEEDGEDDD